MNMGLATVGQIEALERKELERLNERIERNKRERERVMLAAALVNEREKRRKERERHRKELDGMAAFVLVGIALVIMAAGAVSSEKWTVIFPVLFAMAVMRKVGWLGCG